MLGSALSIPALVLHRRPSGAVPPVGQIFLIDADGGMLADADGASLVEPA